MEAYKVPKSEWTYHLAPQLTGRAQQAFAALPGDNAGVYEELQAAILLRYTINEESYRRRFRETVRENGESNRAYVIRLLDLESKWKPETCVKAGEIADEFEQVRKGEPSSPETEREKNKGVRGEHKPGLRCYNCWEEGHVKAKCPKPKDKALLCSIKAGARRKSAGGVYRNGSVEGRQVEGILLDTGCARTMVRKELVPEEKILMGDAVTIRCAHGDTVLYPLAALELEVDGISIPVEVAVSDRRVYQYQYSWGEMCHNWLVCSENQWGRSCNLRR